MNAIRSINLTKLVLLVSFIFFLSCQKQADVSSPTQKSLSDNAFFSRAKISVNLSDRDLVDTIIDFCKRADDISRFSKAVMEKYGYPKWDLTLTLNNENGLKSLMVPVVDTSSQVKLIIFAYQDTKDHVIFKFVGRNTPQPGLPVTTNSLKTLTKESLVGIFKALDKRVAASKIQLNSSMENVKTNSMMAQVRYCWELVGFLSVYQQCSNQIIITPGIAKGGLADGQIGVVEDIQIGDSGGGPGGMFDETTSPGDYRYNKTNFDEETGDLDSKFLNGNYYNLNYTSYSSPDKFPTISPIIPVSKFVGWDQVLHPNWQCMDFAKEQLRVMGYTLSEYYAPNQTIQINTEAAGPNDKLTKEAVGYLLSALKENIPVIVGVDNKAGSPNDATDKSTDHFIVIVGAGNENGIPFFLFYDNATNGPTGVSNNNRLYYIETLGTISGRSDVPHVNDPAYGRRFYTVTQIRKSKKN